MEDALIEPPTIELCVLGSGSRGNCSVLRVRDGDREELVLIDLGFSPRRTAELLERVGLRLEQVTAAVLTHLDHDHCHAGWRRRHVLAGAAPGARLLVHWGHARRAERAGLGGDGGGAGNGGGGGVGFTRVDAFDQSGIEVAGLRLTACVLAHDDQGVAVLRFDRAGAGGPSLGYATDVGCVTEELIEHLHHVSVLAIESNYCPELQVASARPDYLKRRIMGGSGHLSNHESARAAGLIRPGGPGGRGDVVLLHLSSECNRPDLAAHAHAKGGYRTVISLQDEPTEFVEVGVGGPKSTVVKEQLRLFTGGSRVVEKS